MPIVWETCPELDLISDHNVQHTGRTVVRPSLGVLFCCDKLALSAFAGYGGFIYSRQDQSRP